MIKRGDRGQLTVFIILGILLLLSVALVVYLTEQETRAPVRRVPGVPEFVQPVYDYVESCLEQVSGDGIALLGAQGGYINIPGIIANTPSAYVPNDPRGISKTPLWYFEGEDRTPSIEFMQAELARYIRARLPECTGMFESFEEFTVEQGEIVPRVLMTADDVVVELDWPLRVSGVDRETDIVEFVVVHPVRFKQLWLLSESIMRKENSDAWFENLTIDFLAADPDIPLNGVLFQCGFKKWHVRNLKERFRRLLRYNIPRVRVANTQYPPPLERESVYEGLQRQAARIRDGLVGERVVDWPEDTPEDAFEFNRMMMDVGFPRTDLKVGFHFLPGWDLRFTATPNSGGVMSTSQMKGSQKLLPFVCINAYHFTYDVIYPVKVAVRDDLAFNGEGFVFQFGFPVVVKGNAPARDIFGVRKFEDAEYRPDFCARLSDTIVDVRAKGFIPGSPVAEELENVNITYECLDKYCSLGQTQSDGSGHVRLHTFLPQGCSNPLVRAEKDGYIGGSTFLEPGVNEVDLTLLKSLPVEIKLWPYQDPPGQWQLNQVRGLTPTMRALVSVSIRNTSYDKVLTVEHNATESIDLVYGDARYDINVMLMRNQQVIGGYHAQNLSIMFDEFAGEEKMVLNVVEYRPYPVESEAQVNMFRFLYEDGMLNDRRVEVALRPVFT